ncbi:MAG: hypothetical protein U5R49_21595 [Deltaproteobacteria bacterium]|nr:hypothetical protein [Deltaproteobacteria bacterium]
MANKLKVVGIDLASAGNIDAEGEFESKVMQNETVYKKIAIQDDRIVGCIMLGDTQGFNEMTRAMSDKKPLAEIEEMITSLGFARS